MVARVALKPRRRLLLAHFPRSSSPSHPAYTRVVFSGCLMEAAAATMLEAGVGRFRGPSLAALFAEMLAPLAVVLAALATLPSLFRRLQMLVLRLRSRGKEVISSHISTYYSSGDDDSDSDGDDEISDDAATSSSGEEISEEADRGIGYFDGAADGLDGCFPWGGAVVRTWQGLPGYAGGGGGARLASGAVRLWGASMASGEAWWDADDSGLRSVAEAPVVAGWRREHAVRRRRLLPVLPSPE